MPDLASFYANASHFATDTNFEVQRTNHFEVVIDLSQLNLGGGSQDAYGLHLRMSTKSIGAPKVTSDVLELRHGNDVVKVAQRPTYEDLILTVYDTIGRDQVDLVQQWFSKVFDFDKRLMGNVVDYKANATLYMYSPDCQIVRKWWLQGVWPKSFGMGNEFSFDNSDAQTVTIELACDRYWELANEKSTPTQG